MAAPYSSSSSMPKPGRWANVEQRMGKSDPQLARAIWTHVNILDQVHWCTLARLRRHGHGERCLHVHLAKKRPCSACATTPGAAWLEKGDEGIGSMGVVVCWPRATESSGFIFKGCDFSPLLISSARLIEFSETATAAIYIL